jgi:hypothetical protein
MKQVQKATLTDGRQVEFVVDPDKAMEGGMKIVYFTPDKSSVVCFFKDQTDATRRMRLDAVLGKFNPTTQPNGEYWKKLFCWPTGIVQTPRLGIVCPTYPANFFFNDGPWKGREKEGTWFSGKTGGGKPFRDLMPPAERGQWLHYFSLCIKMARAIRKLHQSGLAHSDLSPRNILIDPSTGHSIVIDIDSLVVPKMYPPDVIGTPGYIAPEVLATCHLPISDPNRKHACAATDQYALAVLIYQYLLFRHPLKGPRVNSTKSAEEDDQLSMGAKALFIENPTDRSNRPPDKELGVGYEALGPRLVALFNRVFVQGLQRPDLRPIAAEWEDALLKTWNMLYPCANPKCEHKRLVVSGKGQIRCPFCKTTVQGPVLKLALRSEARPGVWLPDGELVVYHELCIYKWHVYDNVRNNETLTDADKASLADCQLVQGRWLLINRTLQGLTSPAGNRVPPNQAVWLQPGVRFHLSKEPHGRMAEVEVVQ